MCTSHAIKLINIPSQEVPEKPTFRKNVSRKTVRFSSKISFFYYWISRIFLENSSLYAWQDNTYNVSTWKKIISEKTKKNFFMIFYNFAYFSKSDFGRQKQVFPLFLENGSADRAEIFSTNTSTKLGWIFFFSLKSCFYKIWQVLQNP